MQQSRRRPLGDIGNTYAGAHPLHAAKPEAATTTSTTKPRPPACEFKVRSVVGTGPTVLTASSPASPRVDEKNKRIALHVTEYLKEIFEHFHEAEQKPRCSVTYMTRIQTDVNEKMRTILVDWLVDVHLKFKLLPETLFLAVEIIDRFLDKKVVSRQKLQLVGVVAMLLAAKYEEIYPPEVKDFIYIAANTYTRDDILRMERLMFATLEFNLTVPTVYVFLQRGLQVMEADTKTRQLAQYLAELSLLDYKLLAYAPSLIGASCIYLANKYVGAQEPWSRVLEYYSQYKQSDIEKCAADLLTVSQNAPTQKTQAVRKKYSYAKYGEVAKLTQTSIQIP
uniref:Uncharacterized protein n=1 Tax=Eutreptiella gymnastica TaxID=73025 RepID=A0A6U7XGX0_9EUGL|mmetsp:Transcript_140425/g.244481  ORF Transcript_140425/g.244481 Transcript_140425/m.244481 type:complete len:337 (+) Transcript_140425:137-1147(+)